MIVLRECIRSSAIMRLWLLATGCVLLLGVTRVGLSICVSVPQSDPIYLRCLIKIKMIPLWSLCRRTGFWRWQCQRTRARSQKLQNRFLAVTLLLMV